MPSYFNMANALDVPVANGGIRPDEGPMCIPFLLDFTTTGDIVVDLSQLIDQNRFRGLQTIYLNLNGFASTLTVNVRTTNQTIVAKANTQGYYAVLAPTQGPAILEFTTAGNAVIPVHFVNVPIDPAVWPTV